MDEQEDELEDLRGRPRFRSEGYSEWIALVAAGELHDELNISSLPYASWLIENFLFHKGSMGEGGDVVCTGVGYSLAFGINALICAVGEGMGSSEWM